MKLGLDLSNVQSESESKTQFIEEGVYQAKVVETDVKETKSKSGHVLIIYSEVIEGENKGKRFQDTINIHNQNEDAQRIGLARLRKYVDIFGLPPKLSDSNELHGKTFSAHIIEDSFKNDKGDDVKVNKVKSISEVKNTSEKKETKKEEGKKEETKKEEAPTKKKMPWEK